MDDDWSYDETWEDEKHVDNIPIKKTMTLDDVFQELEEKVQEVAELFDISFEQAFLFLQMNNYKTPGFDSIPDFIYNTQFTSQKTPALKCSSAFCDDADTFITYMCGHTFCTDCWAGYISSQVNEGISCLQTTCMGEKCSCKLSPPFMLSFLEDPSKYKTYLVNDYMQLQGVRWCSAGCGTILLKDQCQCGAVTCMGCGDKDHKPIPCDLMKAWKQITSATDVNEVWIKSRTKPCPKCKTLIEKNEGCHHMACSKCKFHWCWVCYGDWKEHGYGKPCLAPTDDAKTIEQDRVKTNEFLVKVNFYFFQHKEAEEKRTALQKQLEILKKELVPLMSIQRIDQLAYSFIKIMHCFTFLGKMMILFYFLATGKNRDILQTNVDFYKQLLVDAYKYMTESTAIKWSEDGEIFRRLQTDCKLIETRKQHMNDFIQSIDGDLQYKCDTLEGWGCAICEFINKPTDNCCKKCTACILHQEKRCVVCYQGSWVRQNPYRNV